MRAVGVIRASAGLGRGDDVGEGLDVVLGKAIGRRLGRGGLEVVQVAVELLIIAQALAHMVENLTGELLAARIGHVGADPFGILSGLVHAHQTDGGEVVVEGAEIVFGVGIQALFQQLGDDVALDLQRTGCDVHQLVETGIEVLLVLCEIGKARHVQRHDADGAGALARTEVAAGLFPQLAQVQTQTAAHRTDIGRLHIGVDVVREVGGAVFGGHLEEQLVVLGGGPVKVAGDGIGRNRVLEAAAVAVALDHQLDEGLVDDVHLGLAVTVGEVHFLSADDGGLVLQVGRDGPVQRDVGEGRLRTPAGGRVHAEDEALDALLDLFVAEAVDLDKGGQIGVKGGEGLGARPLVLHDAEEVDHLVAEGGEVAGRGGVDLARDAEALGDQLAQTPARAVAGQHAQVVQMQVAVAVRIGDLLVIHLAQPVVGRHGAGVGENQTADGIGHGGVLLDAPVGNVEVFVDRLAVIQVGGLKIAHFLALLAVEDVGLADHLVAAAGKHGLDAVLDILDRHETVVDLRQEVRRHLEGQKINDAFGVLGIRRIKGLLDRPCNLIDIETDDLSVPLYYIIHCVHSS